jgi:hypothetical protein
MKKTIQTFVYNLTLLKIFLNGHVQFFSFSIGLLKFSQTY